MSDISLELPVLQNWSCHNCGGCCRQHNILITQEEQLRIDQQQWHQTGEIPQGTKLFARSRGTGRFSYRLNHQADGSCIFLNEQGLCKIHAKFGEAAKPLACRIYPYVFHPKGKKIVVGLRYSCPSVVRNKGTALTKNKRELDTLAELVVPANYEQIPPPAIHSSQQVKWSEFLILVRQIEHFLRSSLVPFEARLLRSLEFIKLLEQAAFDKIQGARMQELCELLAMDIESRVGESHSVESVISKLGRTHFLLLVGQYVKQENWRHTSIGWGYRWRSMQAMWKMSSGRGMLPEINPDFKSVPFAALEAPFEGLPKESVELLERYYRVKVQSLHFTGPAFYGMNLVDGYTALLLVFPVVNYLARWRAVAEGRKRILPEDVELALASVDHHHGFSNVFDGYLMRNRYRYLLKYDLANLIMHYSR